MRNLGIFYCLYYEQIHAIFILVLFIKSTQTAEVDFLQNTVEKVNSHYQGLCTEVLITNKYFYLSSDSDILTQMIWQVNYLEKKSNNPKVILSNDHPLLLKPAVYRAPEDYIPYLLSSSNSTKRFTPGCSLIFVLDDSVFQNPGIQPGLVIFSKSGWPLKTTTDHFIFLIGKAKLDQHKRFLHGKFGEKIREKISYSLELEGLTRYPTWNNISWKEIYRTFFTFGRQGLNLKGRRLQAASIKAPQALLETKMVNGTRTGRGAYYDYILNMQETFNCSLDYYETSTSGSFSNVNGTWKWIGAVGETLGNNFDMIILNSMTVERLQVLDVSFPILKLYMTFKVKIPSYSISWLAPLKPLGFSVWLWVCVTLICFAVIFIIVKYLKRVQSVSILDVFFEIFQLMLSQSVSILPKLGYSLVALALIFSILISTCYNSKLVGFLTFPAVYYPKSLREINSSDNYKVYAVNYGSVVGDGRLRSIYGGIAERVKYTKQIECIENVLKDQNSVCLDYDKVNMYRWNSNFTLSTAHDLSTKIYSTSHSPIYVDATVTFPKDWIFSYEFIKHTKTLLESGLCNFWQDYDAGKVKQVGIQYLKSGKTEKTQYLKQLLENLYESDSTALKMHHISGVLAGWAIFLAISAILFLCEHLAFAKQYCCGKSTEKQKHVSKDKNTPENPKVISVLIESTKSVILKNNNIMQIVEEHPYPVKEP